MKALFLFLLLVNILYGLWQLQEGRATRSLREGADDSLEIQRPGRDDIAGNEPAKPVVDDPVRSASPQLCINLGVFEERVRAHQLRQRLLALGIQSEVLEKEVAGAVDYWLVMEVVGGREDALAQLAVLQNRRIDSFLITTGPFVNNISMGVFGREDYAEARRAQLAVLGFAVRVEPVDKADIHHQVQIGVAARRLVDQALLARLREDFPGLQHHYQPCSAPEGVEQ